APRARAAGDRASLRPDRRSAVHARRGRQGVRCDARAHPPDREQHAQEAREPSRGASASRLRLTACLTPKVSDTLKVFVLLAAVAACMAVGNAQASSSIRYGIQDDAWLEYGPGKLNQRLETFKRLGVPLVRFTVHWNQVAAKQPKAPSSPRDPAYDWREPDRI